MCVCVWFVWVCFGVGLFGGLRLSWCLGDWFVALGFGVGGCFRWFDGYSLAECYVSCVGFVYAVVVVCFDLFGFVFRLLVDWFLLCSYWFGWVFDGCFVALGLGFAG